MTKTQLHLGCGDVHIPGFVNVDFSPSQAVDLVVDLSRSPWPWGDSSVDHIYSSHCLEHLPFKPTFEEIYRILKPGGILHLRVPHGNSFVFCTNPTHTTIFAWDSFSPWTPHSNHSHYGIRMLWNIKSKRINLFWGRMCWWKHLVDHTLGGLINLFPIFYERCCMYAVQAGEIEYCLEKQDEPQTAKGPKSE